MKIYKHENINRTVLELDENELTLIAYLIEQKHHELKHKMQNPLSSNLHEEMQKFMKEEM